MANRLTIEVGVRDLASRALESIQKKMGSSLIQGGLKLFGLTAIIQGIRMINRAIDDYAKAARAASDFSLVSNEQLRVLENSATAIERVNKNMAAFGARSKAEFAVGLAGVGASIDAAFTSNTLEGNLQKVNDNLVGSASDAEREATLKRIRDDEAQMQEEIKKADRDRLDAASDRAQIVARARKDEEDDRKRQADADQKRIDAAQERATVIDRIRKDEEEIRKSLEAQRNATVDSIRADQEGDRAVREAAADKARTRASALSERAARLADLALNPSSRAELRQQQVQQERLQRLAERGGRKMLDGRSLTKAEQFAVESVSAQREAEEQVARLGQILGVLQSIDNKTTPGGLL